MANLAAFRKARRAGSDRGERRQTEGRAREGDLAVGVGPEDEVRRPVDDAVLERCIRAATFAPSSGNTDRLAV